MTNAWCPLFGGFPMLEEPKTTPAMNMIAAIMHARELWGLEQRGVPNSLGVLIWPGFEFTVRQGQERFITDFPAPELVEHVCTFPASEVRAARAIFNADNLLPLAQFFGAFPSLAEYLGGLILTCPPDAGDCLANLLALARKLPEVRSDIPDYAIVAVIAIKEAFHAYLQLSSQGNTSDILAPDIRTSRPDHNALVLLRLAERMERDLALQERDKKIKDQKNEMEKKDAILDFLGSRISGKDHVQKISIVDPVKIQQDDSECVNENETLVFRI
ncbi:MAG: hypothetical protein HQL97_16040 [Magnetococcales bacterium]|nr:hypothetical protein [Magnetococcales bacterium]